jgi:steroid delta-isomerase-like uncharacterized protein
MPERADKHGQGRKAMNSAELAQAYIDAWNSHDAAGICALFAADGTYSDPNVPDGIGGQALADYASGLFAAFSDLSFEAEKFLDTANGTVVAEWMMKGTNDGSFRGLPPTGRAIAVPGVDVIETGADGIRRVRGYVGSRLMMEQLDLQVLVQPKRIGAVSFGAATYTSSATGRSRASWASRRSSWPRPTISRN